MKVYLASRFSTRDQIKKYADELLTVGIGNTSRWLSETGDPNGALGDFSESFLTGTAVKDIEDILAADVLVLFTVDPTMATVRGGRHFESGFAYGLQKPLVTVGPQENIFHMLPDVTNCKDWESAKIHLIGRHYDRLKRANFATPERPLGY